MRTPLATIVGAVELILVGGLNAFRMDYMRMVKTSAENLLSNVNDLLDISALDRGRFKLHLTTVHLRELVMKIANHQRSLFKPGLNFQASVNIDNDLYVQTDPHRVAQVLQKLLSNADKFTKEGEVTFTAETKSSGTGYYTADFTIKDTGIGIAPAEMSELFRPFFQVDRSYRREFGGIGLGVAICRKLIDEMGGRLSCDSVLGQGTTFTISLPLNGGISTSSQISTVADFTTTWYETSEVTSSVDSQRERKAPVVSQRALSVLVVEDNKFNQMLLKKIVTDIGAEVDTADNGEEAVQMVGLKQYALIFMDIQMPIRDGIEATQQIRRVDKTIPIVGLTANCDDVSRDKALKAGMNSLLFKPVRFDDLRSVLNSAQKKEV
jgi:CheY-like chemotaxis protein